MNSGTIRRFLVVVGATSLVAVLGASTVLAHTAAPAARVANISQSSVRLAAPADTDNVQSGDQTTPDTGSAAEADTDNIQSGDQTTPDTGSAADPAGDPNAQGADPAGSENASEDSPAAGAITASSLSKVRTVKAATRTVKSSAKVKAAVKLTRPATVDPAGDPNGQGPDSGTEATSETAGETSNETANDGPGGHQDAAGQDVQHDFQGEE